MIDESGHWLGIRRVAGDTTQQQSFFSADGSMDSRARLTYFLLQ